MSVTSWVSCARSTASSPSGRSRRRAQNGVEIRTPSPGGLLPQFVGKHQWDAKGSEDPGRTLNDLADQLGDLAGKGNGTAVIVIDNVEQASDRDLAAINELAAHLERSGRPVHLVMGGGEAAPTRLMQASMRGSGIESDIGRLYDIRECKPFADYQLQWAATDYMARRGFPMQPDAAQALVRSANGNLSRLYRDAAAAASIAQPPYGVTLATAQAAIKLENERYAPVYEAKWNNSSDAEKTLMAQAAQRGSRGIDVRRMAANLEPAERNELLATAKNLEFRGILRQDATGRWVFADEGMRQQVMTEVGTPGVYQTVPIQPDLAQTAQTQQQAPTQQVDPVVRFLAGQTPLVLGSATGHGARPETAASRGTSPQDRGGREQ